MRLPNNMKLIYDGSIGLYDLYNNVCNPLWFHLYGCSIERRGRNWKRWHVRGDFDYIFSTEL